MAVLKMLLRKVIFCMRILFIASFLGNFLFPLTGHDGKVYICHLLGSLGLYILKPQSKLIKQYFRTQNI